MMDNISLFTSKAKLTAKEQPRGILKRGILKKPSDRFDEKSSGIESKQKHEEKREQTTPGHILRDENRKEDQEQENIDQPEKVQTTFPCV